MKEDNSRKNLESQKTTNQPKQKKKKNKKPRTELNKNLVFVVITQHFCVVNQNAKILGMSPLLLPTIPLPHFTKEIILFLSKDLVIE